MKRNFNINRMDIINNSPRFTSRILATLVLLAGFAMGVHSQDTLFIKGSRIKIIDQDSLFLNGSLVNDSGSVMNSGSILMKGDIINNYNDSIFDHNGQGVVSFIGDSIQRITGKYPVRFQKMIIDKNDSTLMLGVNISVTDSIKFTAGNIDLYGKDIYLENTKPSENGLLDSVKNSSRIISDSGYVRTDIELTKFINKQGLGMGLILTNKGPGGNLIVERGHTSETTVTDGSIKKYFNLHPDKDLSDSITIDYLDSSDFNGTNNNEADFMLWTSYTKGYYYENKYGFVDTLNNFVTTDEELVSIKNPTRLTISDHICDDPPKVNLGPDTLHICAGDKAILNAGNTGSFFIWNTDETTQKINIDSPGKYDVTVTDSKGCFTHDSVFIVVDSLPHPEFTTTGLDYNCETEIFEFTNTSMVDPSGAPMTYLWEFGDGTTSTDSVTTKSYTASGSYAVTLTAYTSTGCDQKATKNVTVNPVPSVNFDFGNSCQTDEVLFTNSSSGVITDQTWHFGNGDTSTLSSPAYTYPDSGKYEVTLIVSNNFGCTDSLNKTINIFGPGKADFDTQDANVCIRNQSVFHNTSTIESGSMTYEWDFGNGLKSTTANPIIVFDDPGTYDVTLIAQSEYGCNDTIQKPVTIYPEPVSDFSFNDVCLGNTTQLTNNSQISPPEPMSYEWQLGDKTISSSVEVNKVYQSPGDYKVKLRTTSSNGCTNSIEKIITIFSNPQAGFVTADACLNDQKAFENHSFPDDNSLTFQWEFGDGSSSNIKNPFHQYSDAGAYAIKLKATTENNCADSIQKTITIQPVPLVDIGDSIFFCQESYQLDAENPGATYSWSNGANSQTITVTESGNYSVTVTSESGCSSTDDTHVNLNSPVDIDLGGEIINACDSITLDAGYPGASYLWSNGATTRKILVSNTGNYSVTVTSQGCSGEASTLVNIHTSPVIDLGPDKTECEGSQVTLNVINPDMTYTWSTGETSQSIEATTSESYEITVTDSNGCSGSDQVHVQYNPLPQLPFSEDVTVCRSTVLDAQNPGSTFLWNDGSTGQTLLANQSGNYTVSITSGNDCSVTGNINVTVNPKPEIDLGIDSSICNGDKIILDAQNSGSDYLWNNGDKSGTMEIVSSGEYWVQVTNPYNCSATDSINIQVNPLPDVNLGSDLYLCRNQQAFLDAGNSGASYSWKSSEGFFSDERNVMVRDSGEYRVVVTNGFGCSARDSIKLQHSGFSINARFLAPSNAEPGDTLQFVDVSYPKPEQFIWDFKDGTSSNLELPVHVYYEEGIFNVKLNVSNNFCSDTISKPITIKGKDIKGSSLYSNERLETELFEIEESRVYPNPTDGKFIYELKLNQSNLVILSMYDLKGRTIYSEKKNNVSYLFESYDFSKLKSGVYIFKMMVKDQEKSYRIVKI